MVALAESIGSFLLAQIKFVGGSWLLLVQSARESIRPPYYPGLIIYHLNHVGIRSLGLILVTALSIGMVISLQFGLGLEKFGMKLYVPRMVSLAIIKEMGPVLTSLMFAARVGAGIASEVASMSVTQQVDAIRALGTSPIKKIVIPRVIACLIALPALVLIANFVGLFGAALIANLELNIDVGFFLLKVYQSVFFIDFMSGFTKPFIFAFFISIIACHYGLSAKAGTKAVGMATRHAVVVSSIMIVISDFFITKVFWIIEKWIL